MDDFKPFYLLILLSSSVILFYFSFKSIVLIALLTVTVLWGTNVVNGSWTKFNTHKKSFKQKSTKTLKGNEKKYRTKDNSRKHKHSEHFVYSLNDSTMPSTIKLSPGPSKLGPSPRTSYFKNQQNSSSSSYLRTAVLNNSSSFFDRSDDHLSLTSNSPTPFLPTIKRALGVSEYLPRTRKDQPASPSYPSHPSGPASGFVPAVRLQKRERSNLSQQKVVRSPTVRIAPPEPHKLSSPRLFHIHTSNTESRRTPDTQAVILALKEKSLKRTYGGFDHDTSYSDYPVQQAKRRRQDSQQSNSSSSSLPPLPDSLPDLSSSGYNIPRLETPTLKRSALIEDWEDSCSAKRLRKDGRVNSIISSLSSSQRVAEKEKQVKRKVSTSDNKENSETKSKQAKQVYNGSFSLDRSDTVLLPTDGGIDISAVESDSPLKDKSALNTSEVTDKPKLDKKITLNQSFTARKRQMSLYSGLNKSFQKVPHANVIASMEDYENDMGAEKKRVQEMLDEIHQAETEKEKEKEKKEEEEKAKKLIAAVTANIPPSIAPVASLQTSTLSTSTTLTVSSAAVTSATSKVTTTTIQSSVPTVSSHAPVTPSPLTFNFATVKSSSPSKPKPTGFAIPTTNITTSAGLNLVSSTGSSSTAVTSTSFSFGTQPAATLQTGLSSSIAPTTVATQNIASGFNFGTNASSSSTPGAFALGNRPATSVTTAFTSAAPTVGFGTNLTAPPSTKSSAPSFNFGAAAPSISNNQTQPTPAFGAPSQSNPPFGMPTQSTSSQPSFGQTSTTSTTFSTGTNPTASTFNFKPFGTTPAQQTTPQASIFGQQPAGSNAAFGTVTSTAAPTPGFGATNLSFGQTATSTAASSGFGMGSSTPSFGTQGSTNFGTGTGFGAAATQSGPFGAATTQSGFAFGAQTTAGSSFGQGSSIFGTANTTKASSFGQGTSSFGTAAATTSSGFGFGQGITATTSSSGGFGFGQGTTATTSSGGFGFGQGTASFGNAQNTGSSFGTSGPSFGQTNSTFGAAPTTKHSSSGSSFGTAGSTFGQVSSTFGAATTQAGSSTFNFGAPSTPANKGGFDFSASSTPANTGGFNFRMADAGLGARPLNKLFATTGIPGMSANGLKTREREVHKPLVHTAKKSCEDAIEKETFQTLQNTDMKGLALKYDMCWQKRGSGRAYDSPSGVGTVIGTQTGIMYQTNMSVNSIPCDIPVIRYRPDTLPCNEEKKTEIIIFDLETSSLSLDCDILQIAACHLNSNSNFSTYIQPSSRRISPQATAVTDLSSKGGVLFYKGSPVSVSSPEAAYQNFTLWLSQHQPVLLAAHNCKTFDSRRLLYNVSKYSIYAEFRENVAGFIDTLPLFKALIPGLSNYKQETIYNHVSEGTYIAHNAIDDVASLKEIITKVSPNNNALMQHSFTLESITKQVKFDNESRENLETLMPLVNKEVVSKRTADVMAKSGIRMQHISYAFEKCKINGIEELMKERRKDGSPRVTNNSKIINKISAFFDGK